MAIDFKNLEIGKIGLIQQQENGRILQIGLTEEQSKLLHIFLGGISQKSSLVQMSEDYDLVLKSSICKTCKLKNK